MFSFLDENNIIEKLEEGYLFYPRNLWVEKKGMELFFFVNDSIKICKIDAMYNVQIRTVSTKALSKLELTVTTKSRNAELIIRVLNEEPIRFMNFHDTNDAWRSKFYDLILEIHAQLSEKM
ncbi:hypothetical protein ABH946_001194 [Bacillus sp. RC145]